MGTLKVEYGKCLKWSRSPMNTTHCLYSVACESKSFYNLFIYMWNTKIILSLLH